MLKFFAFIKIERVPYMPADGSLNINFDDKNTMWFLAYYL